MKLSVQRVRWSGRRLVAILALILLATVVLPPFAAWRLNHFRAERTVERAKLLAVQLTEQRVDVRAEASPLDVVCGTGSLPKPGPQSGTNDWLRHAGARPRIGSIELPGDAWGSCFLIALSDHEGDGRIWLLSAGPNGIVDTPRGSHLLVGDDIGIVSR